MMMNMKHDISICFGLPYPFFFFFLDIVTEIPAIVSIIILSSYYCYYCYLFTHYIVYYSCCIYVWPTKYDAVCIRDLGFDL